MPQRWKTGLLGIALISTAVVLHLLAAETPPQDKLREGLMKALKDGNYKDAYDGLRKLALDPKTDSHKVGDDLTAAINCLYNLGRVEEVDEFREGVIDVHKTNWRLLDTAATTFSSNNQPYGYIVAGKFYRGHKRGGGRYVNTMQRDRVRALQLMDQALKLTDKEEDKQALANFHLHFSQILVSGAGFHEPWRLQYLTDLSKLPDYEDGYRNYYGNQTRGAPVDAEGNPVFHKLPKSYATSQSDGERWRWNLAQVAEYAPARLNEVEMIFANFLRGQFDVETMAHSNRFFRSGDDADNKTGVFAVHTLSDEETIAQLANGIKRFKLPDEFNWIKIYERVAGRGKTMYGEAARDVIVLVYEDRRQYVKAAVALKKAIQEYGVGNENARQKHLDQIVGNWGRFETVSDQAAGKDATVEFRFRNGHKAAFEAHAIKVEKLLDDVKAYLASSPGQLDWNHTNLGNIGYRLVEQQQQQYIGEKVASWDLELKPREHHVDSRVTVKTPLRKPGAYLVTGQMADGNLSRIILWVNDTVIVKKSLEGKVLYFVADAITGQPVAKSNVDFFGWKQVQVQPNVNQWRVLTASFSASTDADGQLVLGQDKMPHDYQWLLTARKEKDGLGGADRFAYLGFTNVWYGQVYDPEYNQTKVFTITDRPVYRPDQKVQFKFWVRHAKYDQPDASDFAGRSFTVQIHNPKGEKVLEQTYTADAWGGIEGEYSVPKGATLGVYGVHILNHGGSNFRVEEYKKPEFEVKVEAPKEPVMLGEKITATIQAKYYFGAPVTNAKVKYKVLRSSYSSTWYPRGKWDWFYGTGYWWFASDYNWYPGWAEWGCKRPTPSWWGRNFEQPEVVLENEVSIGPDGVVSVVIDTLAAKELHGDKDHQYAITAEVVDESRRTIVGTGNVLVARKPFQVFASVDRGHYRVGETIKASFNAHTLDSKPVEGTGELTLYKVSYDEKAQPVEKVVQTWKLDTNVEGQARQQLDASAAGQYRLSYKVTDAKKHTIEGGYVFVIRGEGKDGNDYRFNNVELVTDKREYAPGEKVKLLINTDRKDSFVLLFVRPTNGVYQQPKVLRLKGKSVEEEVAVVQRDMPNFYVEALTVSNGGVHTEVREVIVPPEKRILNVEVTPSATEYLPGQEATVKVKVTDAEGKPFMGSTVLTMYDRSVEYISGGSNVPEIKEYFWKWRRHHHPQTESSLVHWFQNLLRRGEIGMSNLGIFGEQVVEQLDQLQKGKGEAKQAEQQAGPGRGLGGAGAPPAAPGFAGDAKKDGANRQDNAAAGKPGQNGGDAPAPGVEPTVRKNFADTAFWTAALNTAQDGTAEVKLKMPENLTSWKIKVWGMGHGTKVGQGDVEVVTKKNILVRLQAPRFFVEKDEVVLSANVHNYLKKEKLATVSLELEGNTLDVIGSPTEKVTIPAGGEKRVDWRVKVKAEGTAIVRMKAITDEESDAMQMSFPCFVHGMLKMESFAGVVRPNQTEGFVSFKVPAERRINETRLEVRYSPTLAGAMVDALPYMVEYPHGCTEQTLNRFLPTVITQRILLNMKLDLKDIQKKRTNLNAQEIGDAQERAKGWKRYPRNPVFDEGEVRQMVADGIQALVNMQCSDGGWGWFSGWGEQSYPHTTAVVVHGLQIARENGVQLPQGMLERGITWLQGYQDRQLQMIKNAPTKTNPWKEHADELDAFVYMILTDAGHKDNNMADMRDFLFRDRTKVAVYAKAMFGLALHKQNEAEKLAMILKNIEQYVVQDNENQTAYLKLPADNYWWSWYGSEIEADGYYLKLLSRTNPKDENAAGLVKYLLNNRKHATYWNSTRDTAICIEAMAEYLKASGEDKPDMTVEVWLDGKKHKDVKIDSTNLFTFDGTFVLTGDAVDTGAHKLEIKKKGTGPVYFNAYLTNFTLEDFITRAGLEVKVNRKYYKLTRVDKKIKVPGSSGQVLDQKVEKYDRTELSNLASLKSGELVEVELEIDSKNDYEYLLFEDFKPAGFEPMLVRSGYNANDMGAYMELRDERVCFFARTLARGKHSVSYRMRAEIPGQFSALPARGSAMYAPELKGNSDEIKLKVVD
jgi:alpha-2-macroglobulin